MRELVRRKLSPKTLITGVALLGALCLVACLCLWAPRKPEDAEHVAKVFAIVIGGIWVVYQFGLRRAFESALAMQVTVRVTPKAPDYVVFISVELANVGARRIVAATSLTEAQLEEYERSIQFPCDLEIRSLDEMQRDLAQVAWWKTGTRFPHTSLLEEYSTRSGQIDFFMEPGEKYSLGQVFILPPDTIWRRWFLLAAARGQRSTGVR